MEGPNFNDNALEVAMAAGNVMHLLGPIDSFNAYKASKEESIFAGKKRILP
jgi:hypothetical protein